MAVAARPASRPQYRCESCGEIWPRWEGRCPGCEAWNCLHEVTPVAGGGSQRVATPTSYQTLADAPSSATSRLGTGFSEVDRVLGGGFVPGSVVLLGGDPGVGKSTLALQIVHRCASPQRPALYCSGEESADQLRLRARRTGCAAPAVHLLVENDLDTVIEAIAVHRPSLAIVDSVQTLSDAALGGMAGSPAQVRAVVARLVGVAKASAVPLLVIGHVTKEGAIAGPRTLEHMVDVVLYLEGERLDERRLVRGVKNRFGSTGEVGLLAMAGEGMRDLAAPARAFLESGGQRTPGSAVTIVCEGVRPVGAEVQALTVKSVFGLPRRTVSGVELNRLHMLLAVLERRAGVYLSQWDVFVNAAGGLRVDDPSADLAIALAVAGSLRDRSLAPGCVLFGEIGLSGEIRRVTRLEARLQEAAALGLEVAVVPEGQPCAAAPGLTCRPVATLRDALHLLA